MKLFAKKNKSTKRAWKSGIAFVLFGILLFYAIVKPHSSGEIGYSIHKGLMFLFGKGGYIISIWLILVGLRLIFLKTTLFVRIKFFLEYICLKIFLSLVTQISTFIYNENYGGWFGKHITKILVDLFGEFGAFIVSCLVLLFIINYITNSAIIQLLIKFKDVLVEDWKSWKQERSRMHLQKKLLKETQAKTETPIHEIQKFTTPEPPPVIAPEPEITPEESVSSITQEILQTKTEEISPPSMSPPPSQPEKKEYLLPIPVLLTDISKDYTPTKEDLFQNVENLEKTLSTFGINAKVIDINPGPTITRYDLQPAPGVKISSIVSLQNDIALRLQAGSIRIVFPIAGKSAVGIEIPNPKTSTVGIKEVIMSEKFKKSDSLLTIALGKTTDGEPFVFDLIPLPHLLIGGATGTGKSMCIHSIITSILFKSKPDEVKLLLIDPKKLELPVYEKIPHIYDPKLPPEEAKVISSPKEVTASLEKLVEIMESRYDLFAENNVRDIESYNQKIAKQNGKKIFYIVVIIDELADLILTAQKEIEEAIQRLAQMSRAVGIHLIFATQRPSVDVITGIIKANLPGRIALKVVSKVDSRTILDVNGAEDLIGRGDMLFLPPGVTTPIRIQGCYVSSEDIQKITEFVREQTIPYYDEFIESKKVKKEEVVKEETETFFNDALRLILQRKRVSQDLLKAHFGSSARATDLLSLLEVRGFIYKPEGTNRWEIFFDKIKEYLESSQINE